MSDGHSDDERRLITVLEQLGREPAPCTEAGRLIFEGDDGGLAAVLSQIDQTVLPRRLSFCDGDGRSLICDVVERRIMKIAGAGNALLKEEAFRISQKLERFCDAASVIYLRSEILSDMHSGGDVGLSTADLKLHLADRRTAADVSALIEASLSQSESYALAIVDHHADGSVHENGQSRLCEILREMCAPSAGEPEADQQGSPTHQIWIGSPGEGHAVLHVSLVGRHIWIVFEVENLEQCVETWAHLA